MTRLFHGGTAAVWALFCTTGSQTIEPVVAPKPVRIFTSLDLTYEHIRTNGDLPADSPSASLGAAIDVTERFLRLPPESMPNSVDLTTASRGAARNSEAARRLSRFAELKSSHRLGSVVDAYLAGDRLAALLLVFTPRSTSDPKAPFLLYAIREDPNGWSLSFDPPAELEGPRGGAFAALQPIAERRFAEIVSLVTRPAAEPIPLRGTWLAHFRQSNCYFSFDGSGEVVVLQTRGNGTSSYGVFDYHLSGDEIVVEHRFAPLRLRRSPAGWRQDGRWYPTLVADDLRLLFMEYPDYEKGPSSLVPVRHDGGPLTRPTPEVSDSTAPETETPPP